MSTSTLGLDQRRREENENENQSDFLEEAAPIRSQLPLARINADNQDPQAVCCFWVVQIVIIVFVIALIFTVPSVFEHRNTQDAFPNEETSCFNPAGYNGKELYCKNYSAQDGVVGLVISHVIKQNQFALLYLDFAFQASQLDGYNIQQNVSLQIDALQMEAKEQEDGTTKTIYTLAKSSIYKEENILFDLSQDEIETYGDEKSSLIHLNWRLGFDRELENEITGQGFYLAKVTFQKPNQLSPAMDSVQLKAFLLNPEFTRFTILLRYVFFLASLLSGILYIKRFYDIPSIARTFEHRFLLISSVFLMLFNDPIYAATVLAPNPITTYISVMLVVNFLVCLLSMIVLFLHRIYEEDGSRTSNMKNWPKWVYFAVMYIILIVMNSMYAYLSKDDPLISETLFTKPPLLAIQILGFIFIVATLLWILILYVLICYSCRSRNYLWRSYIFIAYSPFFIIMIIFCILSYAYMPFTYTSLMLFAYSYVNIYMYVLQYLYYVPSSAVKQTKENEAELERNNDEDTIVSGLQPLDLTSEKEVIRQTPSFA